MGMGSGQAQSLQCKESADVVRWSESWCWRRAAGTQLLTYPQHTRGFYLAYPINLLLADVAALKYNFQVCVRYFFYLHSPHCHRSICRVLQPASMDCSTNRRPDKFLLGIMGAGRPIIRRNPFNDAEEHTDITGGTLVQFLQWTSLTGQTKPPTPTPPHRQPSAHEPVETRRMLSATTADLDDSKKGQN